MADVKIWEIKRKMTEEELRKEATTTVQWKCTPMIDRPTFINGYITGAESREKRIEQLENENAELKDYRLTTLKEQQTGIQKYALNLEHKLSWYDDQLTIAKDLIESIIRVTWNSGWSYSLDWKVKAEQFLRQFSNGEVGK